MRFSLLALALFAFTLVGCADDFVGPDAPLTGGETASSFAPEPAPEPASPLFSTWSGTDGRSTYTFSFEEVDGSNASDIFSEADLTIRFDGAGSFEEIDGSQRPVRVQGGEFSGDYVQFDIVETPVIGARSETVAQVAGQFSPEGDIIEAKMEFADGTVIVVSFKQVEVSTPDIEIEA